MITLVILSVLIIAGYTAAVCIKTKGIPYSISATYYALDHKLIFGACMTLTAMFLFPVVWNLSTTFTMQLLAIAACVGLIGVGLAPDFKDKWINRIHCGSAALTLISSQLWVGCTPAWSVLVIFWLVYLTYTGISISRQKEGVFYYKYLQTKPMFWIEICALMATYAAIVIIIKLIFKA